jgi:hypothetical protein
MYSPERSRVSSWWQLRIGADASPLDGDTPAWIVSLTVHVTLLLALSLCVFPSKRTPVRAITIVQSEESEPDLQRTDLVILESLNPNPGDDAESTTEGAFDNQVPLDIPAPADVLDLPSIAITLPEVEHHDLAFLSQLLSRPEPAVGEGAVNVSLRDAGDALDYLTAVIRDSVVQRPTTICWLFDQSVSLAGQRKDIAARLENVFEELAIELEDELRHDLNHAVFAYGEKVTKAFPKPVAESHEVVNAILSVPVDESGIENTFTAIREAVKSVVPASSPRTRRNVSVIVFTDEVGNDEHLADEVADLLRRQRVPVPVYVVGVPAPFGRRKVPIRFVEYDTEKFAGGEQWAEVDQGPETLFPEFVRIRTGSSDDESIDSGFGPFSLSKLCGQTHGRYLCLHANRSTGGPVGHTAPMASRLRFFFDPEVMRPYQPRYGSVKQIREDIEANKAKVALVAAASSLELEPMRRQSWVFPKKNDGAFVGLLSEAQHAAAVLAPRIDIIHRCLNAGRTDRPKIQEKRWQAGYDLALGRVLAAKVRVDAYNQILANAKQGLRFQDPKNDTWQLVPSDDITNLDSTNARNAKQARELLEKVVAEHAGTPWALVATRELETPLGYAWRETFTNVNPPPRPASQPAKGGGTAKNPVDDAPRQLAPPKPPRPLENL